MTTTQQSPWIAARIAAQRLGVSEMKLYKWALLGRIRTQQQLGENVRFHAGDVDRLARELVAPASA